MTLFEVLDCVYRGHYQVIYEKEITALLRNSVVKV